MPDLFKEYMPSIMWHKNEVFQNDIEKDKFVSDKSYIINRVLSMYIDCIFYSNMMNQYYHLDGKVKHDFYLNSLRGYKRPFNYAKSEKLNDLDVIKEYYGIGNKQAKEYHSLLTPDQIETLKLRLYRGGVNPPPSANSVE